MTAWDQARAAQHRPLRKPYKPVAPVGPVFDSSILIPDRAAPCGHLRCLSRCAKLPPLEYLRPPYGHTLEGHEIRHHKYIKPGSDTAYFERLESCAGYVMHVGLLTQGQLDVARTIKVPEGMALVEREQLPMRPSGLNSVTTALAAGQASGKASDWLTPEQRARLGME
jgi:hypothetical protein